MIDWLTKIGNVSLNVIISPLRFVGQANIYFFLKLKLINENEKYGFLQQNKDQTDGLPSLGHSVRPKSCVKLLMKAGIN